MAVRSTVIQIERGVVRALVGRMSGADVRVTRVARERLHEPSQDLASALRAMNLPRGPVVLAAPRADTVFKPFEAPAELVATGEWLSMARLQLERHLQTAASGSLLDAMLVETPEGPRALAGAIASDLVERARDACRAVGLKLEGAELQAAGIAALAGEAPAVLIAPGETTTEIVIAAGGVPIFARSIDASSGIGDPELSELDRVSARTAVEVKRTLIGARAAGIGAASDRLIVLGEGRLSESIASACELELGLRPEPASINVQWPEEVPVDDRRLFLPLAGVVVQRATSVDAIDFVAPHRPPDTGAKRRQLVLLALLAVVALVGGAIVAGSMRLSSLQDELSRAESNAGETFEQLGQFLARDARLSHAEQWVAAGQDWVPSIQTISDAVGGIDGAALGELRGDARVSVGFTPGQRVPYPGTWTREAQATFRISGRGPDSAGARALRQAFLEDGAFHVLTQGPDSGSDFSFDLIRTSREQDGGSP
ncbi:MAG: hypothetical protein RIB60_08995 [Phycisphaerales bacterium]